MTLTLWFSKKAKSVVQTSVNLGRQEEGAERFKTQWIIKKCGEDYHGLSIPV